MASKAPDMIRPRDASAAAIAEAIERGNEAVLQLRAELSAAEATRRGMLLTASTIDIERHDARTRALKIDAERLDLQVESLRAELAVARGRERLARLDELRAAADQAHSAYSEFWTVEYPKLAGAIAAGLALGDQSEAAIDAYARAAEAARRDANVDAAGGVPTAQRWEKVCAYLDWNGKPPRFLICLPSTEPGRPIVWPSEFTLQPIQRGEAAAYAHR